MALDEVDQAIRVIRDLLHDAEKDKNWVEARAFRTALDALGMLRDEEA